MLPPNRQPLALSSKSSAVVQVRVNARIQLVGQVGVVRSCGRARVVVAATTLSATAKGLVTSAVFIVGVHSVKFVNNSVSSSLKLYENTYLPRVQLVRQVGAVTASVSGTRTTTMAYATSSCAGAVSLVAIASGLRSVFAGSRAIVGLAAVAVGTRAISTRFGRGVVVRSRGVFVRSGAVVPGLVTTVAASVRRSVFVGSRAVVSRLLTTIAASVRRSIFVRSGAVVPRLLATITTSV